MDANKQQGGGAPSGQQDQFNPGGQQQGGSALARQGERAPSRWRGVRDPFELIARMDEDMDRLFHQFWGGGRSLLGRGRGGGVPQMWAPQVEVFERDGKLHVHADLPGMKKDDVKLSIDEDQLVIQGERRAVHESGGEQAGYFHSERSYGSFYRTIPLPEGIDTSTAEASFEDGVLKVHFAAPQPRQARSRKLDIR
jgi:HSP20 family protein